MGIGGVAVAALLIMMLIARLYLIDRNEMGKRSRYLDIIILVLIALFLADLATIVLF